jgi:hypothetical protein
MGKTFDTAFKWLCTIILVAGLLLWVIPTIFWTSIRVIFELFIIMIWSFIGYFFIEAIKAIWAGKKAEVK